MKTKPRFRVITGVRAITRPLAEVSDREEACREARRYKRVTGKDHIVVQFVRDQWYTIYRTQEHQPVED